MFKKTTDEDFQNLILAVAKTLWAVWPEAFESHLPEQDRDRLRAVLKGSASAIERR